MYGYYREKLHNNHFWKLEDGMTLKKSSLNLIKDVTGNEFYQSYFSENDFKNTIFQKSDLQFSILEIPCLAIFISYCF